jgi:hypothetical protein
MIFEGREILENPKEAQYYRLRRRFTAGITGNKVWLYTVEVVDDLQADKPIIRLRRWRARKTKRYLMWKPTRAYNVRSRQQWDNASKIIEGLLPQLPRMKDPNFVPRALELRANLPSGSASPGGSRPLPADPESPEQTPSEEEWEAAYLHERAQRRISNKQLREMRAHVKTYAHVLRYFERLVNEPATGETQIHDFIKQTKPRWLFGLEYSSIDNEVYFPPGTKNFRFDIMLRRLDGFKDLVELKSPNTPLFRRKTSKRSALTPPLAEALGQVVAYLDACDEFRQKDLFRPKAFIIIGNSAVDDEKQRRMLQSHLAQVELLTYSALIERGKNLVRYLRGKHNRPRRA